MRVNQITIILLTLVMGVLSEENGKCLGLVLKGGGNKGAYEAGAIYALVKNLHPHEVRYDVVSGISVGALNAAHVATYPKGEELKMAEDLVQMWTDISQADLY